MRRLLLSMAGWLALLTIHADNLINISSVQGIPNEEVTVSVSLQNSDAVAALQLTIPLDEQLTLVEGSETLGARATDHQVTVGVKDGVLNVMLYSLNMTALSGTSGEVLSFKLKLGREPKDINLTPSQTVLTQTDGQPTSVSSQSGSVSIRTAKTQYGSMNVDFGHIPIRETYTQTVSVTNVGNEPLTITALNFSDDDVFSSTTTLPLIVEAGDTEELNVTYQPVERGSVEETMQVVCNNISKLNTITLVADPFAVNELHVQNASGVSDEEVTIHLTMNNMDDITGFQFEFALPDALKYVDGSFALSDRKVDHTLLATLNEGVLRAISYSSSNAAFTGEDGEIASFRVRLDSRNGVTLEAQRAVLTAQIKGVTTDVLSAKYSGYVSISSPQLSVQNSIDMGRVPVTEDCTYTLTLHNYGGAPLTVSRVVFDNEALSVAEVVPLTIGAWASRTLTVEYASIEEKDFSATMQVYCNDPAQRLKNITVTGNRIAPNYLTVDATDALLSSNLHVNIGLDNYDAINGLQFDVKIPTRNNVAVYRPQTNGVSFTSRATGMNAEVRQIDDTTVRYFCYFMDNTSIDRENSNVMTLLFEPTGALADGTYQLQVTDIKLGTSGLADKYAGTSTLTSSFDVFDLQLGDVNGDDGVTIFDAVQVVSYILENNPTPFVEPAADINGDGDITIFDAVSIVDIILNQQASAKQRLYEPQRELEPQ